jgi:SAM-dependent methyltransferase
MAVCMLSEDYIKKCTSQTDILQKKFNEIFQLQDQHRIDIVRALSSRIGEINWKDEGYNSPENQRDLSIKYHWGHDHKFSKNFELKGRMGNRHIKMLAEFNIGFELSEKFFETKKVLDVGCWNGGTTLSLYMMGARHVVALEEVQKYAETASILVKDVYGYSDTEIVPDSLYNIERQKYDIIYFPGVIYHLSDPVLALRILFNNLDDGGKVLVETMGIESPNSICEFYGNRVFHTTNADGEFNRGGWNWFVPSPLCLERWMIEAGFEDTRVYFSPLTNRVYGYGVRNKFQPMTRAGFSKPMME